MMRAALRQALLGSTRPTWEWDFSKELATPRLPGVSFTRATTATYFNSSGVLSSASSGTPRFDYDPVTGTPLGYLAEMQSTNLNARSDALTLANYGASSGVASATDGTLGPDGVTEMYKVTSDAGAGYHYLSRNIGSSLSASSSLSLSAFVKQGTERYCTIGDANDSSWHLATFDFQTGAWTGAGTNFTTEPPRQISATIWRIGGKYTNTAATYNAGPFVSFGPNATPVVAQNYNAAGTETGYATGIQVESGGVGVTSYIPTAGSTVTRNQDVLTLPLTSLPGWSASQGGVLVAAYRLHTRVPSAPGTNQYAAKLGDTAGNNSVTALAQYAGGGTRRNFVLSGGGIQGDVGAGVSAAAAFTRTKQAIGWGTSRVFFAADGTAADGDSGALTLPASMTLLSFGCDAATGNGANLNGTLESIAYYRGARPDAFVQAVSR